MLSTRNSKYNTGRMKVNRKGYTMQILIKKKKDWLIKAMVVPVVMYGSESWIIKKVEPQRIYAF